MLSTVLVLFLAVNIGVLYYLVLFGDFPKFARRLDLIERRIDSLVKRDGIDESPEVTVGEESLVVLTEQQKQELVAMAATALDQKVNSLVSKQVEENVDSLGQAKEFFVPLGTASVKTANNEWKDTAVQTELDLANYGSVTEVTFEASLRVPTANGVVQARLVDVGTGIVAGSEVSGEGTDGSYAKTNNLSIASEKRTLKVQMRTSLDYEGVMENARLRIVTE